MTREDIEILIWKYMDGAREDAERLRVAGLIATDAEWKRIFDELTALNTAVTANIEPEQPSMRFTRNIMEEVAKTRIAPSTKKYVNMVIIKGIAAFFIAAITIMLGYAIASSGHTSGAHPFSAIGERITKAGSMLNGTALYTVIAINIMLLLLLGDAILRRNRNVQATTSADRV